MFDFACRHEITVVQESFVNVTNINIESNQLVIGIKVVIQTSENPDYLEDELNNLDNLKAISIYLLPKSDHP